jgi:hypothetical protein
MSPYTNFHAPRTGCYINSLLISKKLTFNFLLLFNSKKLTFNFWALWKSKKITFNLKVDFLDCQIPIKIMVLCFLLCFIMMVVVVIWGVGIGQVRLCQVHSTNHCVPPFTT